MRRTRKRESNIQQAQRAAAEHRRAQHGVPAGEQVAPERAAETAADIHGRISGVPGGNGADLVRGQTMHTGPVTGVGAPSGHVEAAGADLGGDTGDVGTPRDELGGSEGGPHGATAHSEASTVWRRHGEQYTLREHRKRTRGQETSRPA